MRLPDDVCGIGAAISWLDSRLGDTTVDDPSFDELAVSLRRALGSVAYGAQAPDEAGWDDATPRLAAADLAAPANFTAEQVAAVGAPDRAMRAECGFGLGAAGLLAHATAPGVVVGTPALDAAAFEPPSDLKPDARFCAIADELFVSDVAYVTQEPYQFARRYRVSASIRTSLGALRLASRSLDSATGDAVAEATHALERADMSESGLFTDTEMEAVDELDAVLLGECGLGLSSHGLLNSLNSGR